MAFPKMELWFIISLFFGLFVVSSKCMRSNDDDDDDDEEEEASKYMQLINGQMTELMDKYQESMWKRKCKDNHLTMNLEKNHRDAYWSEKHEIKSNVKQFRWEFFKSKSLKRQFELFANDYLSSLPKERLVEFFNAIDEMHSLHVTTKISLEFPVKSKDNGHSCKTENLMRNLYLNVVDIFLALNRDNEPKLREVWLKWKEAIGQQILLPFEKYIYTIKEMSIINGFNDPVEMLMSYSEFKPNFMEQTNEIWEKSLKPLYIHLHTFVKNDLKKIYPQIAFTNGLIPDHIFYNLYSRETNDMLNVQKLDTILLNLAVRKELRARPVMLKDVVRRIETFYTSLGLPKLSRDFEAYSEILFVYEKDYPQIASAISRNFYQTSQVFYYQNTPRLQIRCPVNTNTFGTVTHEIGKIKSMMATRKLPFIFQARTHLNSVIIQAILGTLALTTTSSTYFKNETMYSSRHIDSENIILTYQLRQYFDIMNKLSNIMAFETWRQNVLRGKIDDKDFNKEYWMQKMKFQGIKHVTDPSERGFDVATEFTLYSKDIGLPLKSLASTIMQFQILQALCIEAEQFDPTRPESKPLHECDFQNSYDALQLLRSAVGDGNSKPWHKILMKLTGKSELDIQPMINYFAPVVYFLNKFYETSEIESKGWKMMEY